MAVGEKIDDATMVLGAMSDVKMVENETGVDPAIGPENAIGTNAVTVLGVSQLQIKMIWLSSEISFGNEEPSSLDESWIGAPNPAIRNSLVFAILKMTSEVVATMSSTIKIIEQPPKSEPPKEETGALVADIGTKSKFLVRLLIGSVWNVHTPVVGI